MVILLQTISIAALLIAVLAAFFGYVYWAKLAWRASFGDDADIGSRMLGMYMWFLWFGVLALLSYLASKGF